MDETIKDVAQGLPLISVIVPIYNVEKYLESCVKSIQAQTYKNLEIILVDDGSPDNCDIICDLLKESDTRIKVIHKQNGGLSSARNAGIDIAQGEYIGFVDSDDTIEPFMYEKLLEAIQNNHTKIAVCATNYVFEDGQILNKVQNAQDNVFNFYDAMVEMNSHRLFDMSACSKLYNRDLFDNLRFPVGKWSEDYYIMFKIFDRAQNVSYVSKAYYNYFQRQNSITRSSKIRHDHEYAAREQMLYLDEKYPNMRVLGHTAYASSALTVYDAYLKNNVKCSKEDMKHFKDVVKENWPYIKQADFLGKSKKIQFVLFRLNTTFYNMVFKMYRKIKRV